MQSGTWATSEPEDESHEKADQQSQQHGRSEYGHQGLHQRNDAHSIDIRNNGDKTEGSGDNPAAHPPAIDALPHRPILRHDGSILATCPR
ncbi:hypothetical protein KILIM_002_00070 [Kineosphaera limosa NBRC 100340]|uniref:Uncharacterized protein n=1 Tax=Kineosphaera limosa NBRC 100340 TaxID=1184609 RepID=K6W4G6_9MICO|nr:hypothetical protein KILIM_002_00070 [Kineosphaera limosa NBRC 100340]